MKAITLWQPWASLIAIKAKPYEFRGWIFPIRMLGERVAIHAGARKVQGAEVRDLLSRLDNPRKTPCLVAASARPFLERVLQGLADKGAPLLGEEPFTLPLSAIVCTAVLGEPKAGDECAREFGYAGNDSDRDEHFNWGWPMRDVEPVVPPVPVRGAQGFWKWSPQPEEPR